MNGAQLSEMIVNYDFIQSHNNVNDTKSAFTWKNCRWERRCI